MKHLEKREENSWSWGKEKKNSWIIKEGGEFRNPKRLEEPWLSFFFSTKAKVREPLPGFRSLEFVNMHAYLFCVIMHAMWNFLESWWILVESLCMSDESLWVLMSLYACVMSLYDSYVMIMCVMFLSSSFP